MSRVRKIVLLRLIKMLRIKIRNLLPQKTKDTQQKLTRKIKVENKKPNKLIKRYYLIKHMSLISQNKLQLLIISRF